jgi:hypothetical protein
MRYSTYLAGVNRKSQEKEEPRKSDSGKHP